MASYRIEFKPSVAKDLKALPKKTLIRVMTRIEALVDDPTPPNSLKLAGAERLHRIRVGDHRVVYEIDDDAGRIVIHYVRHRREVYRAL